MKTKIKNALWIANVGSLIAYVFSVETYAFSNSELTQTQVFLETLYMIPAPLGLVIVTALYAYWYNRHE